MKNIYDNGTSVIGNINDIIKYIENYGNLDTSECEELLKDLKELKDIADIAMINYDNPMGYSIEYWRKNDKIKECE